MPKPPGNDEQSVFSIEEVLRDLKEAEEVKDSAQRLTLVGDALDRLTDPDREKLLATPAVSRLLDQARDRASREGKPGTTVCDSKGRVLERVEHTKESMVAEFGMVKWTPMQSRWLSWNGISVYVVAGVECETPPQFRDLSMEAWSAEQNFNKEAAKIMERNFGKESIITTGDGTLVWSGKESS